MKKKMLLLLIALLFSCTLLPMQTNKKYIARLNPKTAAYFFPFCSDFLYGKVQEIAAHQDTTVDLVFKHLDKCTITIKVVSQTPIEEHSTLDQFLPRLNFNNSLEEPTIEWDIRRLEKRAVQHAMKQEKIRKKREKKMKTQYVTYKGLLPPRKDETSEEEDDNNYPPLRSFEVKEPEPTSCSRCKQLQAEPIKPKENWFKRYQTPLVACSVGVAGVASGWFAHSLWQSRQ